MSGELRRGPRKLDSFAVFWGLLCVAANGFAQVEISVPGSLTAGPGDAVLVPVSVDDAAGVLGYFFEIEMDGSVVEFVGAENGGLTTAWGAPTVNADGECRR